VYIIFYFYSVYLFVSNKLNVGLHKSNQQHNKVTKRLMFPA